MTESEMSYSYYLSAFTLAARIELVAPIVEKALPYPDRSAAVALGVQDFSTRGTFRTAKEFEAHLAQSTGPGVPSREAGRSGQPAFLDD